MPFDYRSTSFQHRWFEFPAIFEGVIVLNFPLSAAANQRQASSKASSQLKQAAWTAESARDHVLQY